jgi:hypothetical protein
MPAGWRYLGTLLMLVMACACGSSEHHKAATASPTVCTPRARAAVARTLSVAPGAVSISQSTGNNEMPQCAFSARLLDGGQVTVIANIDSAPSPYFRLERTAIEQSQVFAPSALVPTPQAITGLGLEADWFPSETQLMTTDGLRLITVSFSWPGATERQEEPVAEAVARTYLQKLTAKQANAIANGFPSG